MKNTRYEGRRLPREVQLARVRRVIQEELSPAQRETLTAYLEELLDTYLVIFGGSRNAMFRMKEHWGMLIHKFQNNEKLAKQLQPGSVLAYFGDLGAGKTAFTRGLARGLGAKERVTSPTYTIVNEYLSGRMPLFHFDMYRLASSDDLWDIGWEDYLERGGVCAVEWSENVADAMENAIASGKATTPTVTPAKRS